MIEDNFMVREVVISEVLGAKFKGEPIEDNMLSQTGCKIISYNVTKDLFCLKIMIKF